MSEELDENDPLFAFKKWGPDYRNLGEYWDWRHKRDEDAKAVAAESGTEPQRMVIHHPSRKGW